MDEVGLSQQYCKSERIKKDDLENEIEHKFGDKR
jgi:hypothetical protein